MPLNVASFSLGSLQGLEVAATMRDRSIIITYPRKFAVVWLLMGTGVQFLAFDMRFIHSLRGWEPQAKENIWFFVLMAGMGGIAFISGLKHSLCQE